jgi:cysteine synthase
MSGVADEIGDASSLVAIDAVNCSKSKVFIGPQQRGRFRIEGTRNRFVPMACKVKLTPEIISLTQHLNLPRKTSFRLKQMTLFLLQFPVTVPRF